MHRLSKDRSYTENGDFESPKETAARICIPKLDARHPAPLQIEESAPPGQSLALDTPVHSVHDSTAPIIKIPDELQKVLDARNDMDASQLCQFYRFYIVKLSVYSSLSYPILYTIQENFKKLDRKKQVNGKFLNIDGETSFSKWCKNVAQISVRCAYYRLQGNRRNKVVMPLSEPKEKLRIISAEEKTERTRLLSKKSI